MDRNEKRDRIRGQVRTLEYFFKNLQTWEVSHIGAWLVTGIFTSLATVLICVPYQAFGGREMTLWGVAEYLLWLGEFMYLSPYLIIIEGKRRKMIAEKLKYLPIDRRSMYYFLLRKMVRLLLLLGAVQLVGQCVIAIFCYGRLEVCNILYPLLMGIVLPGAINVLCILLYSAAVKS